MASKIKAFYPPFQKALETLFEHPTQYLWLQLPAASYAIVEALLKWLLPDSPALATLLGTPYLFISSSFSAAATFACIALMDRNEPNPLKFAVNSILKAIRPLVKTSFVVGTLSVLGLMALVLPGIYFSTIYLFVPHSVLSDPRQPALTYLTRSKKLSQGRTLVHMGFVFLTMVGMAWVYVLASELSNELNVLLGIGAGASIVYVVFFMALYLGFGCLLDLWISHYYLDLIKNRENVDEGPSAEA